MRKSVSSGREKPGKIKERNLPVPPFQGVKLIKVQFLYTFLFQVRKTV
jgi:hypothetical protein